MKKSILFPAACSLLAWLPIHAFGGDCDTSRRASTPSSRFTVDGEEVRDKRTGLVWLRCSVGQRWDGKRCFGEIRLLRHQEARRHSAALGHGWRVPAIEELAGIVERRCQNPAINRNIFPDVAELYDNSAKYWSDTPIAEIPPLIYNIDFLTGEADGSTELARLGVRLVKGPIR
ncbi:Lcl C-terminal domain-containing protein [Chromobacterium phragmitis]|uniref:Lcl C-terminal domain-containing protein n=1 Tax=Chromobacterium phragmitis TaxID=2202141 RepID=UPI00143D106F|nr:DUF1566 domain-containing protein [Chromobacterium phragmitis]